MFLLLFSVLQIHAGVWNGSGGGAMVCRDDSGEITKAWVLDLWEAQNVPYLNMEIDYSDKSYFVQTIGAILELRKFNSILGKTALNFVKGIGERLEHVKPGFLEPPRDAQSPFREPGCNLEGLMYYDPVVDLIYVDSEIYGFLEKNSPTHLAAIVVHEAIFYALKGEMKSSETLISFSPLVRRLTACLMQKTPCWTESKALYEYKCSNKDSELYIGRHEEGGKPHIFVKRYLNHKFNYILPSSGFFRNHQPHQDWHISLEYARGMFNDRRFDPSYREDGRPASLNSMKGRFLRYKGVNPDGEVAGFDLDHYILGESPYQPLGKVTCTRLTE